MEPRGTHIQTFGTQCWKMHVIMWNQIAWEALVQD